MIIVGGGAYSQTTSKYKGKLLPIVPIKIDTVVQMQRSLHTVAFTAFLPADQYAKQLGFFCKQEIKMDKLLKVPFRFRLGSVEQCNWLEGKQYLPGHFPLR